MAPTVQQKTASFLAFSPRKRARDVPIYSTEGKRALVYQVTVWAKIYYFVLYCISPDVADDLLLQERKPRLSPVGGDATIVSSQIATPKACLVLLQLGRECYRPCVFTRSMRISIEHGTLAPIIAHGTSDGARSTKNVEKRL